MLYHEAFHQFIHYSAGELPPHSWYNEGHGDYFGSFRDDVMKKVSQYKWLPRADALERVHRVMQPAILRALERDAGTPTGKD